MARPNEPAPFELSHTSEVDGSYSYTYASEDSSKTETRSPQGQVRGAYSYIDDQGILQKIQYVADEGGYQVFGTNLPIGSTVPVKETPEVLEATAEHFALIDKHLKKVALAERLEAEYKALHPELEQEFHHEAPHVTHQVVVPVHHQVHHHEFHHNNNEEEDVQQARALHLAEVDRLTNEHFAALAAAPRFE